VIKRLARYLATVQQCRRRGEEWVSSKDLADALGLTSSTVRQDLSHLDFSGISKRGYETAGLEAVLASVLGADAAWNVAVVGAGNLGQALARHEQFRRQGFIIRAILDADQRLVGRRVGGLRVQDMARLKSVIRSRRIVIGVIAVPAAEAQGVADQFVAAGVKGVLNMTLAHVAVREGISVVDVRIVESLQELSYAIRLGEQR